MISTDLLVIGSSPLVLMRALALSRSGQSMLIIDRAAHPGGSWSTPPCLGFDAVEVGVHLLENRRSLYDALEGFGLQLRPETTSFGLLGGRRIPLGQTRMLFHSLVAAKSLAGGAPDRARRIGTSAIRALVAGRTPFLYPEEGCRAMVGALLDRLDKVGAKLHLGVTLHRIDVDGPGPVRAMSSLGLLQAERVLMASRAHAPVYQHGVRLAVEVEETRTSTFILHLSSPVTDPLGYVEVIGHPWIKRARDVSSFACPAIASGHRLVAIQVRPAVREPEEALSHMIRLGLLHASSRLLDATRDDRDLTTITDGSLRRLSSQTEGRILTTGTTDFADGFVSTVRRE